VLVLAAPWPPAYKWRQTPVEGLGVRHARMHENSATLDRLKEAMLPVEPLQACDISVRFEGLTAIDGVSITLGRNEVLGLIGPNGAGKTTLVNVLTGFERSTEGRVVLAGEDVTGWPAHRLGRAGLARTFQGVRLFRGLSVIENLEAAAVGTGLLAPRR
jgi:branched-chain amino acid transport system ATP-binding protein